MRTLVIRSVVIAAVAVFVHGPALDAELGGRDLLRVADPAAATAAAPLWSLSHTLHTMERAAFGAHHRAYTTFGLVLVVLVGLAWAGAASRLLRGRPVAPERLLPIEPGLVAGAIAAALPFHADAIVSLAGHGVLVLATGLAGSVTLAASRPGPFTVLGAPLLLSLVFGETAGLGALVAIPLVLTRPEVRAALGARRGATLLLAGLALARLLAEPWLQGGSGRDVADGSLSVLGALLRHARLLALPQPLAPDPIAAAGVPVLQISFGVALVGLVGLGVALARPPLRSVLGGAARAIAAGLLLSALAPPLPTTLGDSRLLIPTGLALAFGVAVVIEAAAARGSAEPIALALAVFFVYTSVQAASHSLVIRQQAVFPDEYRRVVEQLDALPGRARDVWLLGLPGAPSRTAWDESVPARWLAPWTDRPRRLRLGLEGRDDRLPAALLGEREPTLICDWRPANLFALGSRPVNWIVSPLLVGRADTGPGARVRLVQPEPDAVRTTAAPRTLAEDPAFEFDLAPPLAPDGSEAIVFFGIYEGAYSPRGRDRVTARRLRADVLQSEPGPAGATRYRWRASIRPGGGEDGVLFEDPDMQLAGKWFWWTVGVVALDVAANHDGHDHAADAGAMRRPDRVAQTRRIRFVAPD